MQTIRLNIDDSIFEKFMGMLNMLPKNKISFSKEEYPSISLEKAKEKVQNATNSISKDSAIPLSKAINDTLES